MDGAARVWEIATSREVATLRHQHGVTSLVFSPDGRYLATASVDRTGRVWEISSGREIMRMSHELEVLSVEFSPDGSLVATASDDGTARLWRVVDENLRLLPAPTFPATLPLTSGGSFWVTCPIAPPAPIARESSGHLTPTGRLSYPPYGPHENAMSKSNVPVYSIRKNTVGWLRSTVAQSI